MSQRKTSGPTLPDPVPEDGYVNGDGPAWISKALGVPGCLASVTRFLSDNGEETALVLRFHNGTRQMIKPARLIGTRRLPEQLGALGFPVPYYSPPDLARLGQAIGRVADRQTERDEQASWETTVSFVGSWVRDCVKSNVNHVLVGRKGEDVRRAIEHVHTGYVKGVESVPVIYEPERQPVAALLVWTVPVIAVVRSRLGTTSDGDLGIMLKLAGLTRERLAARPAGTETRTHELPVWVVYNGWQGIEVQTPEFSSENPQVRLCLL